MAYELSQGSPGSQVLPPYEEDEDRGADDLAGLDEWVVEERRNPVCRVLGRRVKAPAVGRIEDDPRHLPDPVHEEVRRNPEADEPEAPQVRGEARREDREEEDEGVRPDARLEAEGIPEGLVDQVREDRSEEDQAVVESGGGLPGEEPCEAEPDPQVGEEEHRRLIPKRPAIEDASRGDRPPGATFRPRYTQGHQFVPPKRCSSRRRGKAPCGRRCESRRSGPSRRPDRGRCPRRRRPRCDPPVDRNRWRDDSGGHWPPRRS